jgi:alpha-glucosidase
MSSHDSVRHVTRLGGGETGSKRARAALLLLLGLPGQVFLYQGEELGLEEVDVPVEARQDPWFIHTGGLAIGRDGCRVPLPWHKGRPHAGFSAAEPWLPTPPGWDSYAVDAQERSDDSFLKLYRRVLKLRRTLARWLPMTMRWQAAPRGVLRYQRDQLTVACNFTSRPVEVTQPGRLLMASRAAGVRLEGGRLTLPADACAWIQNHPSAHP